MSRCTRPAMPGAWRGTSTARRHCGSHSTSPYRSRRSGRWSGPGSSSTRPPRRRNEVRQPLAVTGALDQSPEPSFPGLLLLRAHDPERSGLAIGRRLRLEKRPGALVLSELGLVRRVESARPVLIRVDSGTSLVAPIERRAPGRMDEAATLELGEPLDVDRAPDAALAPRGDSLRRPPFAKRVADAVDPAKAELHVDDVLPGHGWTSGALEVITQPQLRRGFVVGFEPGPELLRRLEEDDVFRCGQRFSEIRTLGHPYPRECLAGRTPPGLQRAGRVEPGAARSHLRRHLRGGHDPARPRARGAGRQPRPVRKRSADGARQSRARAGHVLPQLFDTRHLLGRPADAAEPGRAGQPHLHLAPPDFSTHGDARAVLDAAARAVSLVAHRAGLLLAEHLRDGKRPAHRGRIWRPGTPVPGGTGEDDSPPRPEAGLLGAGPVPGGSLPVGVGHALEHRLDRGDPAQLRAGATDPFPARDLSLAG